MLKVLLKALPVILILILSAACLVACGALSNAVYAAQPSISINYTTASPDGETTVSEISPSPVTTDSAPSESTSPSPSASVSKVDPTPSPTSSAPKPSPSPNPTAKAPKPSPSPTASAKSIVYKNNQYGFNFTLPKSWDGYKIITGSWQGRDIKTGKVSQKGVQLSIRNPLWTSKKPYQDIPIMIFTTAQWDSLQKEDFSVGAAPLNPSKLGKNSKYVFALPARYNYAYPAGWEKVEEILKSKPLKATENFGK